MITAKNKLYYAAYREKNRERIRKRNIAWWRANRQKPKKEKATPLTAAERYAANRTNELARCTVYRTANPERRRQIANRSYAKHKDRHLISVRNWRANNPGAATAILAKRRSAKLKATTTWANNFFIKEAYHLAVLRTKMFGFKWDVDHIVHLQSPLICGLHWEKNLRVIPRSENVKKGNRIWPGMP